MKRRPGDINERQQERCSECGHPVTAVVTPVAEVPFERASQHNYVEYEHTGEAILQPCGHPIAQHRPWPT